MAYTMGTSGDRNIVNVNGNRYFADKNTSSVSSAKKPTTTTQYKSPSKTYSSGNRGSSSSSV